MTLATRTKAILIPALAAGLLSAPLLAGTKGLAYKITNNSQTRWKLVLLAMENGKKGKIQITPTEKKASAVGGSLDAPNSVFVVEAGATYDVELWAEAGAAAASPAKFKGSFAVRDPNGDQALVTFETEIPLGKKPTGSLKLEPAMFTRESGDPMTIEKPQDYLSVAKFSNDWVVLIKADYFPGRARGAAVTAAPKK